MKRIFCALIMGLFAGCTWLTGTDQPDDTPVARNTNTWVVVIGMENSNYAGACPGAKYDATRMTSLFKRYTPNVSTFISEQATKASVVSAMKTAAKYADLFIFYYSGHGGSATNYVNKEESDGHDEYLCFYDTYMLDDEVWNIISNATGRVVMIFDACHSETMYRAPSFATLMPLSATHIESSTGPSILVMSGCPDDTFSYGDSDGGKLTNTLLKHYREDLSYDQLWKLIEDDKILQRYEKAQRTIIGRRFTSTRVFQ